MGTEGLGQQLHAQFAAQLEALAALQAGRLPTDSAVLAACRGRVPAVAVKELAEAAAAGEGDRHRRSAAQAAAGPKPEPQDAAAGAADGDQAAGGQDGEKEVSAAEQLQAAIRAKLQRLAPQQRKLQQEVLQERSQAQCTEFELLDWRRFRRPLPGANPRAFEPPQQPVALLMAQQAARAQRAAIASRIDRLQLMRLHQEREEQQAQQAAQQQSLQAQQLQQQQGSAAAGGGSMPTLSNPFSSGGAPQSEPQPLAQQRDDWQQQQQHPHQQQQQQPQQQHLHPHQQQPQHEGQVDPAAAAALQHPQQQQLKQGASGQEVYLADHAGANGTHPNGGHAPTYLMQQSFDGRRAAG